MATENLKERSIKKESTTKSQVFDEKGGDKRIFKEYNGIKFMKKADRQILYAVIGFIGGLVVMNMMLPNSYQYKTIFTIIGGLVISWVGYKMATK